jgi:hypothetical protein
MKNKWPQKVYPPKGGDWRVTITSRMALDLLPDKHTLRAELMILQIGFTRKGQEFSIPQNARNCWEVNKTHIGRAKSKLIALDMLEEVSSENNGRKRRFRLTRKALDYHSPEKRQCRND